MNEVHWIVGRIGEARKTHPSVTEAISDRMTTLLKGQLIEAQLTVSDLTSISRVLIADMLLTPPKAEVE